eukprot:TRINITY_DN408_c0_g1_i20.p2 TRINITY_DN408_c0_g1~~TRINITY_DN408_c0_g1_i20.p2  ORF type:complete len:113 (+),score=10.61 TRINITY_DN408_c0_g1_i20:135-473(+)
MKYRIKTIQIYSATESIKGSSLSLKSVDNIESSDSFSPCMFSVGNCISYNTLQETSKDCSSAVSYTHLTLPTKRIVQISVVAVSLKKKKKQKRLPQDERYYKRVVTVNRNEE